MERFGFEDARIEPVNPIHAGDALLAADADAAGEDPDAEPDGAALADNIINAGGDDFESWLGALGWGCPRGG